MLREMDVALVLSTVFLFVIMIGVLLIEHRITRMLREFRGFRSRMEQEKLKREAAEPGNV